MRMESTTTLHRTPLTRLAADRSGGIAIYTALVMTAMVGAGAVAVDVGRMVVLQTQMQNAADSAALSAVTQLDGTSGARTRAQTVAQTTVQNMSGLSTGGTLPVSTVQFFSQVSPSDVVATNDLTAFFVRVTLTPQSIDALSAPLLRLISSGSVSGSVTLGATATATTAPIICNAPPFMICDPSETSGASADVRDPANIGRQMLIKPGGGGGFAPGNFGLLCVPDGAGGTDCGASAINEAIASVTPAQCYDRLVTTATGSKTNEIRNGVNARFDKGTNTPHNPAGNVVNYPRDPDISGSVFYGNGSWDATGYWMAKHSGAPLPAALTGASRWQVYLYELNKPFARNGKRTIFPAPSPLPSGYTLVTPPAAAVPVAASPSNASDNNFDGVPETTPVSDPKRRVVQAAILQCNALGVSGSHEYPTYGRYVELFLTETVPGPPNADIYGEILGAFTTAISPSYHLNAKLVQ
jgi:Flp pilus assembly protein TadG